MVTRLGLTAAEHDRLIGDLTAWGQWVRDGRTVREPLPSGVSSAIRYDQPRVVLGKPGSRPPRGCPPEDDDLFLVRIDEAMALLARVNRRWYALIVYRYLAREPVGRTASALHVHRSTVARDWSALARWLYRHVYGS